MSRARQRLAKPYVNLSVIHMWTNGNTQLSEYTNTVATAMRLVT